MTETRETDETAMKAWIIGLLFIVLGLMYVLWGGLQVIGTVPVP